MALDLVNRPLSPLIREAWTDNRRRHNNDRLCTLMTLHKHLPFRLHVWKKPKVILLSHSNDRRSRHDIFNLILLTCGPDTERCHRLFPWLLCACRPCLQTPLGRRQLRFSDPAIRIRRATDSGWWTRTSSARMGLRTWSNRHDSTEGWGDGVDCRTHHALVLPQWRAKTCYIVYYANELLVLATVITAHARRTKFDAGW